MRAPVFRWNTNVSGWGLWVAAAPGTGSGVGTLGARSGYFRCAHPDFSLAGVRESGRPRYIYPGISCSKPCGNCGNRPLSGPTGVRDDRPRSSNPPPLEQDTGADARPATPPRGPATHARSTRERIARTRKTGLPGRKLDVLTKECHTDTRQKKKPGHPLPRATRSRAALH